MTLLVTTYWSARSTVKDY